ncbi:ABC transporter substrate-binding protein [Salipiger pallidus]|uniref:ABC transporter substrate-binding protein n=1 Tax=Salipiger pallidus TaxID=1775170 RepID=A0A8J2ZL89_9RHOB|nr:transporter substrate-binding domain-containing protein [Salipiger pallidus]GGG76389.1 ABC transporter substrate-binding protein [Salipiger pallidus]
MTHFRKTASAIAMTLALVAPMAQAQDFSTSDLEVSLDFPQPWPLENLIEDGKLIIATTGKTAGETFIGENGELQGARIDLWTKMAEDLGLEPEFVRVDWAGVMPGLAANRFDLGCEGASWNNDRLTSNDFFLTRPVKVAIHVAVVKKDSDYDSLDDLAGVKIGGVKGEMELKHLVEATGHAEEDALGLPGVTESRLALMNGQIDAYGTGLHAATALLESEGGDQFKILSTPTSVGVGGFCVNAREPDLLTAVNFLLAKYRTDGTIRELNDKWGLPDTSDMLSVVGY